MSCDLSIHKQPVVSVFRNTLKQQNGEVAKLLHHSMGPKYISR